MANVSHASLTGSNLHEPKGITTASVGQAYLADGIGSGAWSTISGLSFTGMIAPWTVPIAPSGWYECNGTTISDTTDTALYNVMTIQQNGNRVSGAATISGLSTLNTTNYKVGYYIFGTGIPLGTTILSIDSTTDVTMSANATSSGSSSTVIVSPWQLTAGGIVLPDLTTAGRYLRSRTTSVRMGSTQANQNKQHSHGFTTSGNSQSGAVITSSGQSQDHTHNSVSPSAGTAFVAGGATPIFQPSGSSGIVTTGVSQGHTHTVTMPDHTHTGTTGNDPATATEARPETLVVMWCVKR